MKKKLYVCFIFLFVVPLACADGFDERITPSDSDKKIIEEMNWLYASNPYVDFRVAIQEGDFRYIRLSGAGFFTPVISEYCRNRVDSDITKVISQPHVFSAYEIAKLNAILLSYAQHFNMAMYDYRYLNGLSVCQSNNQKGLGGDQTKRR